MQLIKIALFLLKNKNYENFYLLRDYQGSILAVVNQAGTVVEKRLYDAWGDILKVQDGAGNTLPKLTFFDRGYTGHEHLQSVGLIHMNGRLYDPKLHRFLQPDNYVQDPSNTQNFNRYGYCYNNPLKFTDPSGEFIIGTYFTFLKNAITNGVNFINYNWNQIQNAFKIDMGLFQVDKNRTFGGQFLQILGRFGWEGLQTGIGYAYSHNQNLSGKVDEIEYFGGATFLINENTGKRNGVSIGNFININLKGNLNEENHPNGWMFSENGLFWHEYGHTFQSQRLGLSYLFAIGIPSAFSAAGSGNHSERWYEMQANRWAWRYADKHGYMENWIYPNRPLN